jgi:phosphonate transport system permease protein
MSATVTTQASDKPPRPEAPVGPRLIRWGVTLIILIPFIWGTLGLEISPGRLAQAPDLVWNIVSAMFPPDWSILGRSVDKMLESLYIAWVATIIGALFSFVFGFLAATNMAPRWIATPVRALLSAIRAFPELVLAIMLIPAFGLGAFTGTLALGLHSIGTLGKLTSEVIEGIDEGPLEAMKAAGGTKLSTIRFGVLPQAMPNILAYWLYRFEINVRASAVLGIIGAGGIGADLFSFLKFRDFPQAGMTLLVVMVTVLLIDAVSGSVRRRIISGEPGKGPVSKLMRLLRTSRPALEQ